MKRFFVCVLVTIGLTGCGTDPAEDPATTESGGKKIQLALNWFPEAEHGGFYAALVHGYYEDAGLDVEIIPGGPGAPVVQEVETGRIHFGVANADQILLARDQSATVTAVMAPLQNSPRCIMVREDSGIESFDQLKNVTLAMSGGKPFAMFLKKTLPLENVEFVPSPGGNVSLFLTQKNYAQQAYVFSEPFVVQQKGGKAKNLLLSDLGFNPYASVLFTRQSTIDDSRELVEKFVSASVRGWKKYLAEPDESNDYIQKQNPEMARDILNFAADAMGPLCQPGDGQSVGGMQPERWTTLVNQMIDIGAIGENVKADECFTTEFLQVD